MSFDVEEANPDNQGEHFNIKDVIQYGKFTIVEFYSLFCPDCLEMEPKLELLGRARPDIAIRRLNTDRPDKREIDWNSPLAKQYNIHFLPAFILFDREGNQIAEGDKAKQEVSLTMSKYLSGGDKHF